MRVIFLSEKAGALFLGGAYLGLVDLFERSVEIDPKDGVIAQICPTGDFLPLTFQIDEDFLLAPPPQIDLYFGAGFVAVYAHGFLRADQSLKVLWQNRFGSTLLTLCLQGKLQLTLGGEKGFFLVDLPDALLPCTARPFESGFLLEGETAFALVSGDGKLILSSEGKIISAEESLLAEVPFHDSIGHVATCEWRGGELISCTIRSAGKPTESSYALALFESVLIGADALPYLHESLAEKADKLKEFLGSFVSVVMTDEKDTVGLVYPRTERVFDVRYYRVSVTDGKISNISPIM